MPASGSANDRNMPTITIKTSGLFTEETKTTLLNEIASSVALTAEVPRE